VNCGDSPATPNPSIAASRNLLEAVGAASMKMLAEYLEHAIKFEQMAAQERDAKLKEHFETQAAAYRKLAEKRAQERGIKIPPVKNA
jgi:hypothetical protein